MSEKIADAALFIWSAQNELLLDYGIDVVNRSFCLNRDIEQVTFTEVDACLSLLERDTATRDQPITIKLNSVGGDVHAAWAIVSRIKASPCPITVEAYGCVMSAATMIFCAGGKRRVSKYAEFMFHQSNVENLSGSLHALENMTKGMRREEEMYCTFLHESSKKSRQFWKKLINSKKDVFLTAEQVIKLGLAQEIF